MQTGPTQIIDFWQEAGPERWFAKNAYFDRLIADNFGAAHLAAACGELASWESGAAGAMALILLTDQFPRNLYRDSAHAFATDAMARQVANRAIAHRFDTATTFALRPFFYLPFEHHEDAGSQARAVALAEVFVADGGGDAETLRYARLHADIIARFGRFPHRNSVMGRISTDEEIAYLAQGGFAG